MLSDKLFCRLRRRGRTWEERIGNINVLRRLATCSKAANRLMRPRRDLRDRHRAIGRHRDLRQVRQEIAKVPRRRIDIRRVCTTVASANTTGEWIVNVHTRRAPGVCKFTAGDTLSPLGIVS